MEKRRLFVYGTLMQDFRNYLKYINGQVSQIEKGYVLGSLYHLKTNDYPIFLTDGEDKVWGEVISLPRDRRLLADLDKLEGFAGQKDDVYQRRPLTVHISGRLETVEAYVYAGSLDEWPEDELVYLASGDWRVFKNTGKV